MGSPATRRGLSTQPALEVQERARFQHPLHNRRRAWIKKSEEQLHLAPPRSSRENIRSADWAMGRPAKRKGLWTPRGVEDSLRDPSVKARARFQPPSRKRRHIPFKKFDDHPPPPPDFPLSFPGRGCRSSNWAMIPIIQQALDYYNARHPGGEFDVVRPLSEQSVYFRGHMWWHLNFLARCRSSSKIRRFFAELHYRLFSSETAIVESCTIIEEPLDRYRMSCAFCSKYLDILHPMDTRTFICGNGDQRPVEPADFLRSDLGMPPWVLIKLQERYHQGSGPVLGLI